MIADLNRPAPTAAPDDFNPAVPGAGAFTPLHGRDYRRGYNMDRPLAARLQEWVKLRNVLVHQYARVDMGRLHGVLQSDLGDIGSFAAWASELLHNP
jgi:hypothetical protein